MIHGGIQSREQDKNRRIDKGQSEISGKVFWEEKLRSGGEERGSQCKGPVVGAKRTGK